MRTMDARYKLLLFVLVSVSAFVAKDIFYGTLVFASVCLMSFAMGQIRLTLKFMGAYACVLALIHCCIWLPGVLQSIVLMLGICVRMFLPLLLYARAFTATTTVSELVAAMHLLRVPRSLALAFTVAIRFFPMAKEEMGNIHDAMRLRGIGLSARNLFTRPGMVFEGALMPIMMRAATISEELAASSVSRGIDNPGRRTSYRELAITANDTVLLVIFGGLMLGVVVAKGVLGGVTL